jgi:hypothetical protein
LDTKMNPNPPLSWSDRGPAGDQTERISKESPLGPIMFHICIACSWLFCHTDTRASTRLDLSNIQHVHITHTGWYMLDHEMVDAGSPRKGAKTNQNVWPLPQFKNFQLHEWFDDLTFCLFFSFGGNYKILVETTKFWWKLFRWELIFFDGN